MQIRSALFLALAVVIPALGGPARATGAAQVTQFKGTRASTFAFFGPGAICADGSVGTANGFAAISGADAVDRQPGSYSNVSSGASIDIFGFSTSCNNDFIGFGIAGFSGGYKAPNPQLTSASLKGTTTVQDLDFGATYPLSVDLVFTGQGPLSSSKGTTVSHDSANGYTVNVTQGASSVREAGVTGTIVVDGVEVDASFFSTDLVSNSSGQTVVTKKK